MSKMSPFDHGHEDLSVDAALLVTVRDFLKNLACQVADGVDAAVKTADDLANQLRHTSLLTAQDINNSMSTLHDAIKKVPGNSYHLPQQTTVLRDQLMTSTTQRGNEVAALISSSTHEYATHVHAQIALFNQAVATFAQVLFFWKLLQVLLFVVTSKDTVRASKVGAAQLAGGAASWGTAANIGAVVAKTSVVYKTALGSAFVAKHAALAAGMTKVGLAASAAAAVPSLMLIGGASAAILTGWATTRTVRWCLGV